MNFDEHEQIDWLAFRYLSGELSDDECETFEQLLETDQAAREAVAAGVELTRAVRMAYEDELSPSTRVGQSSSLLSARAGRRAGWAAAVGLLCASLLLVLWVAQRPVDREPVASHGETGSTGTAELAEIWLATRDELASQAELGSEPSPDWLTDAEAAAAPLVPLEEETGEPVLPSWLLAALSASREEQATAGTPTP